MNELFKEYTLSLATEISKKLAGLEMKQEDQGGAFKVVATTEDVDRDGEVIKVKGWDFKNYMKNSVIIANHKYLIENIIGKATKIYEENGKVIVEGVFSKANPLGQLAEALYNEGMLKTVSVGFMVKKRNDSNSKIIEEAELLELSFVAVPCNPEATSLDGKIYKKGVEMGLIKEKKDFMNGKESFQKQMKKLLKKLFNTEYVEIYDVWDNEFVFRARINERGGMHKIGYTNDKGTISLKGTSTAIESDRVREEKAIMQEILQELKDLKKIKEKSMSDDNDKKDVLLKEEGKQLMQSVNKMSAQWLHQFKKSREKKTS